MKKYKVKRVEKNGYIVTEHGHTMFTEDVEARLERLVYLEKEKLNNSGYPLLYDSKRACAGCSYEGDCGDKDVNENCFDCVRAFLIREAIKDNYKK